MMDKDRLFQQQREMALRKDEERQRQQAAGEMCTCGRLAFKIHCPYCGSYTTYALCSKRDFVTRQDGSREALTVFRCRRCNGIFYDDDWRLRCHAPHYSMSGPGRKVKPEELEAAHRPVPTMDDIPDHMKAALEILKKKRGIE